MNKIISTSKKFDSFFKVIGIIIDVAGIALLVCLGLLGIGYFAGLDVVELSEGFEFSLGFIDITLSDSFAPNGNMVLLEMAVMSALGIAYLFVLKLCIKPIRNIFQLMAEGKPFNNTISLSLKKLAIYCIILNVAENIINWIEQLFILHNCDLENLLVGEKIKDIAVNFDYNLNVLIIGGILMLLSYVFKYGAELQTQVDETL